MKCERFQVSEIGFVMQRRVGRNNKEMTRTPNTYIGGAIEWLLCIGLCVCLISCAPSNQELASLRQFYASSDPKALTCLRYTALVVEAHDIAGPFDPPELVAGRLYDKYKDRLPSGEQQEKLSKQMNIISNIAIGFGTLSKLSAQTAFMQICRYKAKDIEILDPNDVKALTRKFESAESCEKKFGPGDSRTNCVAVALVPVK